MAWLVWIALLLLPMGAEAQKRPVRKAAPAKAAAQAAWPIESIAVEGNKEYAREQILGVAGLRVGQVVTAKDFEAARSRLEAAGVFEELGVKYAPAAGGKGYSVSVQVTEAGPLFPVRFEDLAAPNEQLVQALKKSDPFFGLRIAATQAVLARYAKVIDETLAGKQKVVGKLGPDDAGQMVVVFRPVGALPAVSRVTFTGNQVIPTSTLENTINAVAVGMAYKEARFRQVLETNIRPLYEARGRVRVSFPEVRSEQDRYVTGLVLTVRVLEGASYSLGEVAVTGSAISSAELLKAANLKRGDMFNLEQVQAAAARIERRVRREGYMRVKSRIDRNIDDKAMTAGLTIHVEDGPRYVLGKLNIDGLDLISEPAIRKLWAVKQGQPFNADYPDYFLNRVREDGVLDDLGETKAVVKPDDAAKTVDVTLLFRGEAKKESPNKPGFRP